MEIIFREDARLLKLLRFFTGKPCKHGHVCERFVVNGVCVECCRNNVKKWEKTHPEKVKERNKRYRPYKYSEKRIKSSVEWQKRNKEKVKQTCKKYYEANKEKVCEGIKKWNAANPDRVKEIRKKARKKFRAKNPEKMKKTLDFVKENYKSNGRRNRRAKLKGAVGRHTQKQIEALVFKQCGNCVNCLSSFKATGYHVDHIIPLSAGGGNMIENIQLLCPTCNLQKSAKDPIVFARENGRLL